MFDNFVNGVVGLCQYISVTTLFVARSEAVTYVIRFGANCKNAFSAKCNCNRDLLFDGWSGCGPIKIPSNKLQIDFATRSVILKTTKSCRSYVFYSSEFKQFERSFASDLSRCLITLSFYWTPALSQPRFARLQSQQTFISIPQSTLSQAFHYQPPYPVLLQYLRRICRRSIPWKTNFSNRAARKT